MAGNAAEWTSSPFIPRESFEEVVRDGMRILKSEAYMDFSVRTRGWQDSWEQARDAFLDAYPRLEAYVGGLRGGAV